MVVSPFVCESPMLLNLFCFLLFFFKLYFVSLLRWTIKLLLLLLLLHYGERLIQVFVFCLPRTILPQHYLCFIQISLNLNSILYYKNIFVVGSSSQAAGRRLFAAPAPAIIKWSNLCVYMFVDMLWSAQEIRHQAIKMKVLKCRCRAMPVL